MKKMLIVTAIPMLMLSGVSTASACGGNLINSSGMKMADANRDKKVTKDEFFAAYAPYYAMRIKGCSDQEFAEHDKNNDGVISSEDYRNKAGK